MKKLLIIAIIGSLFLTTSCKKDDHNIPLATQMVGVWKVEDGQALVSNGKDINDTYDISAHGTLTLHDDGTGQDDFSIQMMGLFQSAKESYTWTVAGSTFLATTATETFSWEVEEVANGFNITQSEPMSNRPDLTVYATLYLRK